MTTLFVSTMLAVCLLPYISIGDGRESRTTTTYRSCTMFPSKCNIRTIVSAVALRADPRLRLSIGIDNCNFISSLPIPSPWGCRPKIEASVRCHCLSFRVIPVRRGCDNLYIECCTCLIIRNKIDMSIVTLLEAPNHLCACY